ncbi:hypothetical protein [Ruegeria meonggei]|uniref:Uncharacterized protein n=1 Tax=Ruegeria meonggei TaxID=1446476 RepID=A0A1X7ADP6_9RHOB|nr:hypothetical protein [Ruegeria meonggei]SLN77051.1 hypothetical protein RUM8411_04526 [Ruegeria meonggei]
MFATHPDVTLKKLALRIAKMKAAQEWLQEDVSPEDLANISASLSDDISILESMFRETFPSYDENVKIFERDLRKATSAYFDANETTNRTAKRGEGKGRG